MQENKRVEFSVCGWMVGISEYLRKFGQNFLILFCSKRTGILRDCCDMTMKRVQ